MTGIWTPSSFAWKDIGSDTVAYYNTDSEMIIATVSASKDVEGSYVAFATPHMIAQGIYLTQAKAKAAIERGVTSQLKPPSVGRGN
jgi:hypothetical protein